MLPKPLLKLGSATATSQTRHKGLQTPPVLGIAGELRPVLRGKSDLVGLERKFTQATSCTQVVLHFKWSTRIG